MIRFMKDRRTIRLPISLAAFDNLCHSGEILSMQASIAELVSSANRTNISENISRMCSVVATFRKNEQMKRIRQTSKSCRNASSSLSA